MSEQGETNEMMQSGYQCLGCGQFDPDPIPTWYMLRKICRQCDPNRDTPRRDTYVPKSTATIDDVLSELHIMRDRLNRAITEIEKRLSGGDLRRNGPQTQTQRVMDALKSRFPEWMSVFQIAEVSGLNESTVRMVAYSNKPLLEKKQDSPRRVFWRLAVHEAVIEAGRKEA